MKIDKNKLTFDWHSKAWIVSVLGIVGLLIQQIARLFGWEIPAVTVGEVSDIVTTVLALLSAFGVFYDTSNKEVK